MGKIRVDALVEGNLVKHNHGVDDFLPDVDARYVNVTGDTMTGGLTIQPSTSIVHQTLVADVAQTNNLVEYKKSDLTLRGGVDRYGRPFSNLGIDTNSFFAATAGNINGTGVRNVAIGSGSLVNFTTGNNNVGLGFNTLAGLTTGAYNLAIGSEVLKVNNGSYNMSFGANSLVALTTGDYNSTIGGLSGYKIQSGNRNVLIGYQAGAGNEANQTNVNYNISIGSYSGSNLATNSAYNVFIGDNAGFSCTVSKNTMIGYRAGYSVNSGSSNIIIGYNAGYRHTLSNRLIIDNAGGSTRASEAVEIANSIIYGVMASTLTNQTLALNAVTTVNGSLSVVGNTDTVQFKVKGNATQTSNLQEWVDSSNAVYFSFGLGGVVFNEGGIATTDFRVESDTETNMLYLDANGNTDGQLFFGGNTVGQVIEKAGDTYWQGDGSGLPYGSCWGNEIGWTQASAVQNTWYEISDTDMADGQLNLVTHDGSGKLTVSKAGRYLCSYTGAFEASTGANVHIQTTFSVSGTETNDGMNHFETFGANVQSTTSGTVILDLAANDTVEVSVRTTDAGTPNISCDHLSISIIQVGGT